MDCSTTELNTFAWTNGFHLQSYCKETYALGTIILQITKYTVVFKKVHFSKILAPSQHC